MQFYDGNDVVDVNSVTKIYVDMTTMRNISYDVMDMQFLVPKGTTESYFHLCRAEIVSVGKNMPCMTPGWYNNYMQYFSR